MLYTLIKYHIFKPVNQCNIEGLDMGAVAVLTLLL